MPAETPGQALRRARHQHDVPIATLCRLLDTSSSALWYAEHDRGPVPQRWLSLLPPEIAIPVIEAVREQHWAELDLLAKMLKRAKNAVAA